jgi:hypothetical protein
LENNQLTSCRTLSEISENSGVSDEDDETDNSGVYEVDDITSALVESAPLEAKQVCNSGGVAKPLVQEVVTKRKTEGLQSKTAEKEEERTPRKKEKKEKRRE